MLFVCKSCTLSPTSDARTVQYNPPHAVITLAAYREHDIATTPGSSSVQNLAHGLGECCRFATGQYTTTFITALLTTILILICICTTIAILIIRVTEVFVCTCA